MRQDGGQAAHFPVRNRCNLPRRAHQLASAYELGARTCFNGVSVTLSHLGRRDPKEGARVAVNPLIPVVPQERFHRAFRALITLPTLLPARNMIADVATTYDDKDRNFVEQFQTTAFEARLWELYLHATLSEWGFSLDPSLNAPDYVAAKDGTTLCLEGVTVNPTQVSGQHDSDELIESMSGKKRLMHEALHFFPIKFGSTLYSKLRKEYWKLPHVQARPFVIAVEDFHAPASMIRSSSAIAHYLYGFRHDWCHASDGTLTITPKRIDKHIHGKKEIPSGFFDLPGAENVSAVLFSGSATIAKFNRMGYLRGYGNESIMMFRQGTCFDHDPNASTPLWFEYEAGCPEFPEDWKQGLSLFHNPRAIHPVSTSLFRNIAQHRLGSDGIVVSTMPAFHPFGSRTWVFSVANQPALRAFVRTRVEAMFAAEFKRLAAAGYPGVLELLDDLPPQDNRNESDEPSYE